MSFTIIQVNLINKKTKLTWLKLKNDPFKICDNRNKYIIKSQTLLSLGHLSRVDKDKHDSRRTIFFIITFIWPVLAIFREPSISATCSYLNNDQIGNKKCGSSCHSRLSIPHNSFIYAKIHFLFILRALFLLKLAKYMFILIKQFIYLLDE